MFASSSFQNHSSKLALVRAIAATIALASIVACAAAPDDEASGSSQDAISATPEVSWCSLLVQGYPQFSQYSSEGACRAHCLSGGCVTTKTRDAIRSKWDSDLAAVAQAKKDEEAEQQGNGGGGTVRSCARDSECPVFQVCVNRRCEL